MGFPLLLTVAAATQLPGTGSTAEQSPPVVWEIESYGGESTRLERRFEVRDFPVKFECEGTPPVFEVLFVPEGRSILPRDFDRTLGGTIRIPPEPVRNAEWKVRSGSGWLWTALDRIEIEFLVESAGALEIEVQTPEGQTLRHRSPESTAIAPAVARFLEACDHHTKETNRRFDLDGIEIELQVEVDDAGIEDIRALAAELGIRDVQRISVGLYGIPVSRLAAIVESRAVREGDKITQTQLKLSQKYWTYWASSDFEPDGQLFTRGLWQTSLRDLYSLDRWIVRDGDWSIEVRLGAEVPYEDAVRIVRAIRTGKLVDVREGPAWVHVPLSADPYDLKQFGKSLPRITRDANATTGEAGRYVVDIPTSGGSGTTLDVRLIGDRLEVVGVSVWIV